MIGTYLGEYAMTYNPTRHGKPAIGGKKWYLIILTFIQFNLIICFKKLS